VARKKSPVLDLLELCESTGVEMIGEEVDCVVGGYGLVDEGNEGMCELFAARYEVG